MPSDDSKRCRLVRFVVALTAISTGVSTTLLAMDRVREETGVNRAVQQLKVSGRGVLVALMDRGIDWENKDFCKPDGSTRIKYIYDLMDDRGATAAGNHWQMGTIYEEAAINRALCGGKPLATRDAVGHGTTTAGIPCGNGSHFPSRKYRGIAPNSSLLVVKLCSDGAPAHDGEPAEAFFYEYKRVLVAIDFIREKARGLKLPCVMLLNIGSQGGPTDGTSELCQRIDATVGPGIPGLLFVTGPGDEGSSRKHNNTTILDGRRVKVGTIWDGASAKYNICPGDYVIRTHWTDIDGMRRSQTDQGTVGEIWTGSSIGPTTDGRFGIDVCAPGDSLFTTYNRKSHWATHRYNLIQDGRGNYGRASAVSAAAPIVTGILALMLEVNPSLDAPTAKRILQRTARPVALNGRSPNEVWGYGKVDAFRAIQMAKHLREAGKR